MKDEPKTAAPSLDVQLLAQSIAAGIAQASNQYGPIKQIPITKYRSKTAWNPQGLRESQRPQFARTFMQNGMVLHLWHVHDDDILRLNQLKPGRYLGNRVTVTERMRSDGQASALDIMYNNATTDQRFELKNLFRSFSELLQMILQEQEAASAA